MRIKPICYTNDGRVFQSTLHRVIRSDVWVAILNKYPATINPFPGKCTQYLHGFPHPPKKSLVNTFSSHTILMK
jgi:hypothetical protein